MYESDFDYQTNLKLSEDELNPSSNDTKHIRCEYSAEIQIFYDLK
jgi:hypothetical protein